MLLLKSYIKNNFNSEWLTMDLQRGISRHPPLPLALTVYNSLALYDSLALYGSLALYDSLAFYGSLAVNVYDSFVSSTYGCALKQGWLG